MRASFSLGAMVASSFAYHAAAQAGYDSPSSSSTSPDGGSVAANSAGQANPPQNSGSVTANGANSDGNPQGNGQSCLMEGTTTVFVTIHPANPALSNNNAPVTTIGPDGANPGANGPTRTVQVSPVDSANGVHATVQAFTTVTISDLWSPGSHSGNNPASSVYNPNSAPGATGRPFSEGSPSRPGGYGSVTGASASKAAETSSSDNQNGSEESVPQTASVHSPVFGKPQGTVNSNSDGTLYTVVTDTNVDWTTGPAGPSPVTVLSVHTLTLASAQAEGTLNNAPAVTCWTVTGSDGKETVVESTISTPQANGGVLISAAVPTSTGPAATLAPQVGTSAIQGQVPVTTITASANTPLYTGPGIITSTAITTVGPDGVTTVVNSVFVVQSVPVTDGSGALPSGSPLASAASPGSPQGTLQGGDVTSRTTFTVVGPDGKPTVVESTLIIPASAVLPTDVPQNLPNGISMSTTPSSASQTLASGLDFPGPSKTCTSYTLLGSDGKLTVVESTYLASAANPTQGPDADQSGLITGVPSQPTFLPGQAASGGAAAPQAITTCVSWTALGPNGIPTVVESTIVLPNSNAPSATQSLRLLSVQDQSADVPQGTQVLPQNGGEYTTSITVDITGPNGIATPVVETVVLTPLGPGSGKVVTVVPATTFALPSVVPQPASDLPSGISPAGISVSPVTTAVSLTVIGPNGSPSPVVQTVVIAPQPQALTAGSPNSLTVPAGFGTSSSPSLQDYGATVPQTQVIPAPSAPSADSGLLPAGTNTAIQPASFTIVTGPGGIPVLSMIPATTGYANGQGLPPSNAASQITPGGYGWLPAEPSPPAYAALQSPSNLQALSPTVETSTWINVIPEPTTTYTMKFPLTTLATVPVSSAAFPVKRALQRRHSLSRRAAAWSNSSSTALLPTPEANPITSSLSPVVVSPTSAALPTVSAVNSAPATCSTGTKIGNTTLDFDAAKPGPLFNPTGDFWFSEGFLVVPGAPDSVQAYTSSSGGQLVQFVPPTLVSSGSQSGCSETAEIGLGPNSANSCFRFNLYSANLGCAARANEKWCEFDISAYTFNTAAANEMSIAWSEVKRVPASSSFPSPLTPVAFDNFQNITSVLINVRVNGEARTWWADDFVFGWTDDSCTAAQCRQGAAPQKVKREAVESAVRRGVWQWTPSGLNRLSDEDIWDAAF